MSFFKRLSGSRPTTTPSGYPRPRPDRGRQLGALQHSRQPGPQQQGLARTASSGRGSAHTPGAGHIGTGRLGRGAGRHQSPSSAQFQLCHRRFLPTASISRRWPECRRPPDTQGPGQSAPADPGRRSAHKRGVKSPRAAPGAAVLLVAYCGPVVEWRFYCPSGRSLRVNCRLRTVGLL